MPATAPPRATTLLAADRRRAGWDPSAVVRVDAPVRGAVALQAAGGVRRAEPGPAGPLTLEARLDAGGLALEVHGPSDTPPEAAEAALGDLAAWVGVGDDPAALGPFLSGHARLRDVARRVGEIRIGCLPTVGEAVGRAVLAQLVQVGEARRSMSQVVALAGTPAGRGLWCWPTARQVGAVPAWTLRRCGISLRGARALHAAAVDDARLAAVAAEARQEPGQGRGAWARLDARLRSLPGVGAWTGAKVRAALGDVDAVPVGDWNLPVRVCTALTGEDRGRAGWTDEHLLELLAPFAGQRGRVIRLVGHAAGLGLLPRHRRRAPRAPRSAHRYW